MVNTYKVGILQANVYRILKDKVSSVLEQFNLSSPGWALLGTLFDEGSLRSTDIAEKLGCEVPFVTVLVDKLEKMKFVERMHDEKDKRAKRISLTKKGKHMVPIIEESINANAKLFDDGLTSEDFDSYIRILESIVKREGV